MKLKKKPKVTFTLDKVIEMFVFLIMLNFLLRACSLIMSILLQRSLALQTTKFVIQ
ncbi:hypothetical protein O9A_00557 [Bartonella koehlerae C-29]|uniref:Uncharacterized protein n=1 Tax=Bartonella koehlerae C-29 TaxID=1134510 RepID=A0A067W7L1_9HYPH|nr:hypothetical protein O9A_00557 [Bartonella koehlerae C-29]